MYKAYGVKFVIIVQGRAGQIGWVNSYHNYEKSFLGKFDLKNTVINVVAGLGLLSFITIFCDFILLNYVSERNIVSELSFGLSTQVYVFLLLKGQKQEI